MKRSRKYAQHIPWSEAELDALRSLYPSAPWAQLEAALPGRGRSSIKSKASALGVTRNTRFRMPEGVTADEAAQIKRARRAAATASWRARNPEANRASQAAGDQRPERKKKQAERARAVRRTPEHREKHKAYKRRPDVRMRDRERQRSPERRAYLREWNKNPRQRAKQRDLQRAVRATPEGRLNNRMRVALRRGIGCGKAGRSWTSLVDYSAGELKTHLERQFLPGMSWENAEDWHIDHVTPLREFSFSSPDDPEFKAAWALSNLRPLWAKDNLQKSGKVVFLL